MVLFRLGSYPHDAYNALLLDSTEDLSAVCCMGCFKMRSGAKSILFSNAMQDYKSLKKTVETSFCGEGGVSLCCFFFLLKTILFFLPQLYFFDFFYEKAIRALLGLRNYVCRNSNKLSVRCGQKQFGVFTQTSFYVLSVPFGLRNIYCLDVIEPDNIPPHNNFAIRGPVYFSFSSPSSQPKTP